MRKAVQISGVIVNIVTLPDDWTGAAGQWQPPVGSIVVDEPAPPAIPAPSAADVRQSISVEAERRKSVGTIINGIQFRCDDASLVRLQGMVRAAERAEAGNDPYSVKFRTAAGVTVEVTTAAQASAMEAAAAEYVGRLLTRSAELQTSVATMTEAQRAAFVPSLDSRWN